MDLGKHASTIGLIFLVFVTLFLLGCGSQDDFAELRQDLLEIKQKPRGHIDPPPKFKTYENFLYGATLMRSPFQPPVKEEPVKMTTPKGKQVQPDLNRPKEVLEEFSLEALAMVGSIRRAGDGLFALIKDNKDGIHRVRPGNYLGRNHGKILSIEPSRIDLMELIPDGQDGWVERPRTVTLRDE